MFGGWWASNAYEAGGIAYVAAWVIWVVLSITFHELAHGWVAVKKGDQTPIVTGHMTFNPIVHMGIPSLVMFALLGIAWGAMPIDPTRMRGKYAEAWVALAGPAMNFLLAMICVVAGGIMAAFMSDAVFHEFIDHPALVANNSTDILPKLVFFAGVGSMLNIALGLFNLFPFPPLDGWRILSNLSRRYRDFTMTEAGRAVSMVAMMLAFLFGWIVTVPAGMIVTAAGMGGICMVLRALGVGG